TRSCSEETMRESQKFLSNVFSLIESIILDGNAALGTELLHACRRCVRFAIVAQFRLRPLCSGTEIVNLDALRMLTAMIEHAHAPELVQGAATLLDTLILLRAANLVALEHAGAV